MARAEHRRERLVSPLAVCGLVLLFGGAFALLSPLGDRLFGNDSPGRGALDGDARLADTTSPDAFDVAWLRARAAAGHVADDELADAVTRLARDGRTDEARALLSERPPLALATERRRALDIELAAADWRATASQGHRATPAAGGDADRSLAEERAASLRRDLAADALRQRLIALRDDVPAEAANAGTRDGTTVAVATSLLERAGELALGLGDATLAVAFWTALADREPAREAHWLARCGRRLSVRGEHALAIDCLERAMAAANEEPHRFDIGLERLALAGDEARTIAESLFALQAAGTDAQAAFATLALAAELPDIAARVYRRLARTDTPQSDRWLVLAARWYEAAGDPAAAAESLQARAVPDDDAAARALADDLDRLQIAAGARDAALDRAAERIATHPSDADALQRGIRLAQSVGEVGRALRWNAAWLERRDDDIVAMDRQVDLALAVGQPAMARTWATRALAIRAESSSSPGNDDLPERHERLAQLAEWTSDPDAALEHRRWLAERLGTASQLDEVARLAETVHRPALAADARLELALREAPSVDELDRLIELFERDGRPGAAAAAIERVMEKHGENASRMRALARLHERHVRLEAALAAWRRHANLVGATRDATLAEVDLLWRLDRRDEAASRAETLVRYRLDALDERDVDLLAEIAWRYRLAGLTARVQPLVDGLSDADRRAHHAQRAIASLERQGRADLAADRALEMHDVDGDAEFALIALRLAVDHDLPERADRLLATLEGDEAVEALPAYWSLRAARALQGGDVDAARDSFERALAIDPIDAEASAGLLWLAIGDGDETLLRRLLDERVPAVAHLPALWPAIALAHVGIGDAPGSLVWFERAIARMRIDYALLLGWADALDEAGQPDRARQVRRFAVTELRPRLRDGVLGSEESLLRQYGRLLSRYGRADDNEAWMRYVLATDLDTDDAARIWREDMAIAWLMATERHEHARLIMARRHSARLATPQWQDMALALRVDDSDAIEAMLDAGASLSAGTRMLALRAAGREADAFALALRTLGDPASSEDLSVARRQFVELRRQRPSHATLTRRNVSSGDLSIVESAFGLRHAPGVGGIGYALDVAAHRYASDRFEVDGASGRRRVELGLFERHATGGFGLTAGIESDDSDDLAYARAWWAIGSRDGRRELQLSGALSEPADESPELRLAGARDRVAIDADLAVGRSGFLRLGSEYAELRTRIDEQRLARGMTHRAEVGLRGTLGTLDWSGSLAGEDVRRDRAERLPEAFLLSRGSSLDRVLAERRTSLTLNGSLGNGAPGSDFPDGGWPRWRIATGLGHVWPDNGVGLQLGADAGVRVLGNDELGVALRQDMRLSGERVQPDETRIGLDYRHQF